MAQQREATLEELLSEPIILTVMARDGVRSADIRRLLQQARSRDEQTPSLPASGAGRFSVRPRSYRDRPAPSL